MERNIMDSNMIKRAAAHTILFSLFAAVLLVAGCDQDRGRKSSAADPVADAWIRQATVIAEKIPVNLHEVEHDRSLSRTAVVALEVGAHDRIDEILDAIDSWRKADLYAKLARTCYVKGDFKEGDQLIERARRYLREHQFEEWQVSRVHVAIEEAGHLRGKKTEASLLRQLEPSDQAKLLPSMVSGNLSITNLVDMLTRLEGSTNDVLDLDMASATVDTYRLLYEKSQEAEEFKELRERVLGGVEKTFRHLHDAIACQKLLDFCYAAVKAGDTALIDRLTAMLEERSARLRVDMRIPVLLRYAEFLADRGQTAEALAQLSAVEANIDDPAVLFADRPVFLARCGVLYGRAGDTAKMHARIETAIARLNTFKNARPRAMTAVDICHICARAGIDSAAIKQSMAELYGNLSDPW
jgi:hypothetical protein